MFMSYLRRVLGAAALLCVATSCNDSLQPGLARLNSKADLVADGARGGNAHFFLLPPLVPAPQFAGVSDPDQAPSVVVCEWSDQNGCGAVIASFDRTDGSPSTGIVYDAASEAYHVNWNTGQCATGPCSLDPAKTYRLRVLIGSYELGFADVDVVENGKELKNVQTNQYIGLVDGRTLPVKFRIEKGAATVVAEGVPAEVTSAGGVLATADGLVSLEFPAGAVAASTQITISKAEDPALIRQAWSEPIDLGPDGTTFSQPVKLTLRFDASKLPPGLPMSALGIVTWAGDSWVEVPGSTVNETDNTVSAPITHFSVYYVYVRTIVDPTDPFSSVSSIYIGHPSALEVRVYPWRIPAGPYCYYVSRYVPLGNNRFRYSYERVCVTVPADYDYTPDGVRVRFFAAPYFDDWSWLYPHWIEESIAGTSLGYWRALDPSAPVFPPSTPSAVFGMPGYGITANGIAFSPPLHGLSPGVLRIWTYTGEQLNPSLIRWVFTRPVGSLSVTPRVVIPLTGPGSTPHFSVTMRDAQGVIMTGQPAQWGSSCMCLRRLEPFTGRFQAMQLGSATVQVSAEGKQATMNVTIVESQVAGIELSPTNPRLSPTAPNNTTQLSAVLRDIAGNVLADRLTSWSSSNPSVAVVDANGLVTAVGTGTAAIMLTSEGVQNSVTVTVGSSGYLIAFHSASVADQRFEVVTQYTDGSGRAALVNNPVDAIGSIPRWSPDGGRIVYQAGSPQSADVFIMNADGSNHRNLTNSGSVVDAGPSFSPDGEDIVFTSTRAGNYDLWLMNADGGNVRRLTTNPAPEGDGSFSPDGRRIAFVRGDNGARDVWVMDVEPGPDGQRAEHQVTAVSGNTAYARWSPDGRSLMVASVGALFLVDPNAIRQTHAQMSRVTPATLDASAGDWSPDGAKIAFTGAGEWNLYLVNPDGSGLERIPTPANYNEAYPSFRPVASTLPVADVSVTPGTVSISPEAPGNTVQLRATMRDRNGAVLVGRSVTWSSSDVSVATVDASGRVTAVASGDVTISATSEGVTGVADVSVSYVLVFDSNDPSTAGTEIIIQESGGGKRRVLTSYNLGGGGIGSMARWSPNGAQLVYQIAGPQHGDLYVINADGSGQRQLTANAALNAGGSFSPNGDRIAFLSTRNGNYDTWVMNADGSNPTQLTRNPTEDGAGVFSPDGKQIAFTRSSAAGREIWVLNVAPNADGTHTERQVTANGDQKGNPRWSPDGSRLLFARGEGLYTVDAKADMATLAEMTRINTGNLPAGYPDWSSDGRKIVFTAGAFYDIYLVNVDGSRLTRVPTPAGRLEQMPSFKP
jgi:Tol biopolymer transport system component